MKNTDYIIQEIYFTDFEKNEILFGELLKDLTTTRCDVDDEDDHEDADDQDDDDDHDDHEDADDLLELRSEESEALENMKAQGLLNLFCCCSV